MGTKNFSLRRREGAEVKSSGQLGRDGRRKGEEEEGGRRTIKEYEWVGAAKRGEAVGLWASDIWDLDTLGNVV